MVEFLVNVVAGFISAMIWDLVRYLRNKIARSHRQRVRNHPMTLRTPSKLNQITGF